MGRALCAAAFRSKTFVSHRDKLAQEDLREQPGATETWSLRKGRARNDAEKIFRDPLKRTKEMGQIRFLHTRREYNKIGNKIRKKDVRGSIQTILDQQIIGVETTSRDALKRKLREPLVELGGGTKLQTANRQEHTEDTVIFLEPTHT